MNQKKLPVKYSADVAPNHSESRPHAVMISKEASATFLQIFTDFFLIN